MHARFAATCLSLLCAAPNVASAPAAADLKPKTLVAFQKYAALTEQRVVRESATNGRFLHLDYLPEAESRQVIDDLRRGEMYMERLETVDANGEEIDVPDGLIHHWLGAVFIPGVGVEETLAVIQDYDRHSEIYAPEVEAAHIIRRDGDEFEVFMRFRKKKVITVVMNTVHDVVYTTPAAGRTYSISRTTAVQEVENAGSPSEKILADGEGGGFLWRINSYWRFLERDGGTYIECESISLTRTIPFMVRWLVAPFVNDVPREQLAQLLSTTRRVLVDD